MTTASTLPRTVRAPRGTTLSCRSWLQEAALRMLMNNLDPDVAERPDDLVVYGGIGQGGAQLGVLRRDRARAALARERRDAPRAVGQARRRLPHARGRAARASSSNSNLVPAWATWEHFRELERKGLMMYGQMTAGSWIYIGTQGILQGTYETFAAAARTALRREPRGQARGHRRPRRHGRRPAARGDDERRGASSRRGRRARIERRLETRLPRRDSAGPFDDGPRARARGARGRRPLPSASSATRPTSCPSS